MLQHFLNLARYSKLLFLAVVLCILVQLYFSLQFARLSKYADSEQPLPHPIGFEAFPFVTYNMYSGKITDWHHYGCYKIKADSIDVQLSNWPDFTASQIENPVSKYLQYQATGFNEEALRALLIYQFDSSAFAAKVYRRISNSSMDNCSQQWGLWLLRYLSAAGHKQVHTVQVFSCLYQYNNQGRPEEIEEKQVYQYP